MRAFLSWSGAKSEFIAVAFRKYLLDVLPSLETWISVEDIHIGARWTQELVSSLNESQMALLFITRENRFSPWLHYEAGFIARTCRPESVIPILVDIQKADLLGPLSLYQCASLDRGDIERLLSTLVRHVHTGTDLEVAGNSGDSSWEQFSIRFAEAQSRFPLIPENQRLRYITSSETKILRLLSVGKSVQEVAAEMGLSQSTVKTHILRLHNKFEVHNNAEMIQAAREMDLI